MPEQKHFRHNEVVKYLQGRFGEKMVFEPQEPHSGTFRILLPKVKYVSWEEPIAKALRKEFSDRGVTSFFSREVVALEGTSYLEFKINYEQMCERFTEFKPELKLSGSREGDGKIVEFKRVPRIGEE